MRKIKGEMMSLKTEAKKNRLLKKTSGENWRGGSKEK